MCNLTLLQFYYRIPPRRCLDLPLKQYYRWNVMIPHTKALKVYSVPSFSGQGGLSAAPARAVSAVKNMNLPEIPRNINIGDINIKVPSLSPFWTAFPLSSAGLVHYWYSPSPPSSLVKTENTVLFFNKCTIKPHQFTFTFIPVCMGGKL